jgi:hypothetical protein
MGSVARGAGSVMTRTQAVETARRMHAGGWAVEHIRCYLRARGHAVAWSQVKAWVDPDYDERRKARERERQREHWRAKHRVSPLNYRIVSEDSRDALMLTLRQEDGLSYAAIAAVANRFMGADLTPEQVRFRLYDLGVEKNPNKARSRSAA